MAAADDFDGNRRDLGRRFPQAEDDFRETLPHRALVIDLGKAKVLKGLLAKCRQQPLVGMARVGAAVSNLVQEGT